MELGLYSLPDTAKGEYFVTPQPYEAVGIDAYKVTLCLRF